MVLFDVFSGNAAKACWWWIWLAVHVFLLSPVQAQSDCVAIPPRAPLPTELIEAARAQYEADSLAFHHPDKKLKKEIREYRQSIRRNMLRAMRDSVYIHGTVLDQLLDSIMDELVRHDGQVQRPRVFLSWYDVPNAATYAEGTIVVYLGLMRHLRSKDELAFILAHELAHYSEAHGDKAIVSMFERVSSSELQAQVKDVMRQQYGRRSRLESLLTDLVVDFRKHGRTDENESDSLAMVRLTRAGFDARGGVGVMQVLLGCDKEQDPRPIDIKRAFDHPGVDHAGLKERAEGSTSSLHGLDTFDTTRVGELATHPDCMDRASRLRRQAGLPELEDGQPSEEAVANYAPYKRLADQWVLESWFDYMNVGRVVFMALQKLQDEPDDPYWNAAVARGFAMLYKASREHDLGFVLDHPRSFYEENYATYLSIMQGMRMGEFLALAEHYLARSLSVGPTCEATLYAQLHLAHAKGDEGQQSSALLALKALEPTSRYLEEAMLMVRPASHKKKR